MSWSDKYKRSINCDSPKGFSQRAHCSARKKRAKGETTKSKSPFNEMMEHCGCEDNAVQELETGLKKLDNTSYDSIDSLMRRIMKKHDMTAKQLHNAFVDKHHKTPDDWINEGTLHHWFKGSKSKEGKPGWVQADGSPCANEPGETKTPKCFSSARLKALKSKGKKGESLIRSAVRRKREEDPGQQQKSGGAKPTNVPTFAKGKKNPNYVKAEPGIKEEMELNEAQKDRPSKGSGKKDACYHKVKSRYKVWPSAYASGALVKCRKAGAANWGTHSEDADYSGDGADDMDNPMQIHFHDEVTRYCPACQKNEKASECKYGKKYWRMFSVPTSLTPNQLKYNIVRPHPGNFPESYDHEYSMARSELSTIISAAKRLKKKVGKGEGNLEAWVQSKITKAADYIDTAADYLDSGEGKVSEACWDGYEQQGMKKKGKKLVPNCVKKEGYSNWREELGQIDEEGGIIDTVKSFIGLAKNPDTKVKNTTPMGKVVTNLQKNRQALDSAMKQLNQEYEVKNELIEHSNWREELGVVISEGSTPAWQRKEGKNPEGGLNKKGIASYRREHPGSHLSLAVTTKPSKLKKGSKSAKRRKSFCSRMKGMKAKLTSAKTARDPDSRINKSLRKWNC